MGNTERNEDPCVSIMLEEDGWLKCFYAVRVFESLVFKRSGFSETRDYANRISRVAQRNGVTFSYFFFRVFGRLISEWPSEVVRKRVPPLLLSSWILTPRPARMTYVRKMSGGRLAVRFPSRRAVLL